MEFEFDPNKSRTNKKKQSVDFVEIQALWDDPDMPEIPARVTDEPRFLVIGVMSGKHWSAVIAYRGDTTRIISARRSNRTEVELYES
jgi:uncharacterized DUF497 family protein